MRHPHAHAHEHMHTHGEMLEQRVDVCVCRYFKSHSLLVEQRLERDKLSEVVRESDAALRYG